MRIGSRLGKKIYGRESAPTGTAVMSGGVRGWLKDSALKARHTDLRPTIGNESPLPVIPSGDFMSLRLTTDHETARSAVVR